MAFVVSLTMEGMGYGRFDDLAKKFRGEGGEHVETEWTRGRAKFE